MKIDGKDIKRPGLLVKVVLLDVSDAVEYEGLSLESKSVWISGDIQDMCGIEWTNTSESVDEELSPSIHTELAIESGWTGVIRRSELRNLQMLESAHLVEHIGFGVFEVDKTSARTLLDGWRLVSSERIDKR